MRREELAVGNEQVFSVVLEAVVRNQNLLSLPTQEPTRLPSYPQIRTHVRICACVLFLLSQPTPLSSVPSIVPGASCSLLLFLPLLPAAPSQEGLPGDSKSI